MTDRESPRSRRPLWAGIAAISGGLGAILLTVPFAAAYLHAYEGFDGQPVRLPFLERGLSPLLGIAAPRADRAGGMSGRPARAP
ncbi:MAG: hypothetical protein JWR57_443 [Mycetocola sp.]|nr:hypothetical protein [Mycetocola sp.]